MTLSIPSAFQLPGTINKITITQPGTGATITIADGKTATISNTLTLTGTDGSSIAFGTGGTVSYAVGANPSATAGPTAVNGTSANFMRADGAPAIQKGLSSQFGIVECDNVTITCPGGVLTASGGSATSITVGTTTIVSGTNGRIEYNNSGVLGELTTTGSGTVAVLATSPTIAGLTVTGSLTATGLVTNADLANPATTVNGQTCTLGSTCTVTAAASGVTVGTTTITSGTNTRVEFNNSGVLGEYAISGTGNVAMTTSPSFTTPAIGAATGSTVTLTGAAPQVILGANTATLGAIKMFGNTSGDLTINPAAVAGTSSVITFPAGITNFSATGGISQVIKQTSSGGAFTVARLACADLSDSSTGCSGAASATGANPTATAGPTAVNGVATTFMRSDGAPAVQKGTAAQFGIVEADNTTITSASGVLSAVNTGTVTSVATNNGLTGGTITTTGTIGLAAIAADNLLANSTGSSAAPIATSIGSCSTGSSALTYNTSTHAFGCNSISGGSGLTVGTTTITSGTNGRIEYNNSGVLGELTTTGSGTVAVLATSPTLVTPVIGAATGTSLSMTGGETSFSATAIPSGGTTGTGVQFSSTANNGLFFGTGAPTLTAAEGSLYLRNDTGHPYYNSTGSTTWVDLAAGGGGSGCVPAGSATQILTDNGSGACTSNVSTLTSSAFVSGAAAASPAAFTMQVGASSRAGTDTDTAGASGTITSGIGTGSGAASSLIFQTPTAGSTGTSAETLATRFTLGTTAATITTPLNISNGNTALASTTALRIGSTANSGSINSYIMFIGDGVSLQANVSGGNGTIRSGMGSGNSTGSSLIFQTPAPTTSGTGSQTQTTQLTVNNASATFVPPVIFGNGSAAAPSWGFTANSQVGFYSPSTNTMAASINGTEDWLWTSTIFSPINASGGGLVNSAASSTQATFYPNRSNNNAGIGADTAGDVSIIANNSGTPTEVVRITGTSFNLPGLTQSSAAQSGTLCYSTAGASPVTYDATLGCLASLEELKDIKPGGIKNAEAEVNALKPFWYTWKTTSPEWKSDKHEQPGLGAHATEKVDPRLVGYGPDGKLRGVRYAQTVALLIADLQEQSGEIAELKKQNAALVAAVAHLSPKPLSLTSISATRH